MKLYLDCAEDFFAMMTISYYNRYVLSESLLIFLTKTFRIIDLRTSILTLIVTYFIQDFHSLFRTTD